jgi:nifR3 family TIM-barrel protein
VTARGAQIVDLNFGCPAKKVVKNGEGAGVALMRTPDLLEEIASLCVKAVEAPVTAKIRLGWSPCEKNGPEIAKRLEGAGVQMICVHARTRDQVHWGETDLDTLAKICNSVSIPVIGNGGIRSLDDARNMMSKTGCAQVAVGQAAKGNPWIFRDLLGETREVLLKDRIEVCRRHLDLYLEWGGEDRAVREMRKHVAWYLKGFDGAASYRKRINEAASVDTFRELLLEIPV